MGKRSLNCIVWVSFFIWTTSLFLRAESKFIPEKDIILTAAKNYFQKLYSLEFSANMHMELLNDNLPIRKKLQVDKLSLQMKFFSNGIKYRSEVTFGIRSDKRITQLLAYNGEIYQFLDISQTPLTLTLSKKISTINIYNAPHPILCPFAFVFSEGDILSLNTLQSSEKWLQLGNEIEEISSQYKFNYEGVNVIFKKKDMSGNEGTFEVFFAKELNYFPVYCRHTTSEGIDEMKVLKITKIGKGNNIIIPIFIELNDYFKNGQLVQKVIIEIDPNSLKVNQPIKEEIFTIPFSQVDNVFDIDNNIFLKLREK